MNRAEKEAYLREYGLQKAKGKPFFPYAVAKDSLMACIVMFTIILLSLVLGAELGPKADPTTTTYVRRPERRPIATIAGIFTICAMGYLTYLGANAGSPNEIDMKVAKKYEAGKLVMAQSGCLACHKVGENGNDGPGPHLTNIADRLPKAAIRRTLENPTAPMPSYAGLPEDKKTALVDFLAQLHDKDQ
jgi:menaquinol-cytochrome c reductase cytochrome b/c subunit